MKKAIIVILFLGLINCSFAASTSKNNKTKVSSAQRHAAINTAKKYLSMAKKYSRYANNPAYAEKMRQYLAGAENALKSGNVSQSDSGARSVYKDLNELRNQVKTSAASGGASGTQAGKSSAMTYNQAMTIYNAATSKVMPRLNAIDNKVSSMSKKDLQKHMTYMNYVKGKLSGAQQFFAAKSETKSMAKKMLKMSEHIDKYIARASKAAAKAK